MAYITNNIIATTLKVREYEAKYGRLSNSVGLLAVSKRHSIESIKEAAANGINNFGENYLQEAMAKISALNKLNLSWHYIGPIQSNKTLKIAENFEWVHSIDRKKIALRLNEHRENHPNPLKICVQVNLSNENSKSGIPLEEAEELCMFVNNLSNLQLRGLMSIPAPEPNFDNQRTNLKKLKTKFVELQEKIPSMDTLSMGMSNDFEAAIAEGSTLIRLGTALFGPRT